MLPFDMQVSGLLKQKYNYLYIIYIEVMWRTKYSINNTLFI